MMRRRETDAEAELNLPPGFRFHPTDEELVLHYLCRKITYQTLSVPIIAEIDLYKYNPSQLPDMALFGTKEWYFFTPRDRKYPNGSRPNRAAGSGYWKATGADKPIRPTGTSKTLGIKKALVFYSGKAPKGTKTNWIMHEYRLAEPTRPTTANNNKDSLRLDDWVLCRIYNKKNNWHLAQNNPKEEPSMEDNAGSESFSLTTSDSDMDNGESIPTQPNNNPSHSLYNLQPTTTTATQQQGMLLQMPEFVKQDSDWFMDLNLDDLKNSTPTQQELTYQDYLSMPLTSPHFKPYQTNLLPFWSS